jgi:hypothetical protein
MNKTFQELLSDFQLPEKITKVKEVAQNLFLYSHAEERASCYSLVPLSLALMEASQLYSMFCCSSDKSLLSALFDGNETKMPNLDTRLKCIRDLCSASNYGLNKRDENSSGSSILTKSNKKQSSPGAELWLEIIKKYAQPTKPGILLEVARLIDDILESMLCISNNLDNFFIRKETTSWDEIVRHSNHIKDHFDFAEDALIATMRPAEKEQ